MTNNIGDANYTREAIELYKKYNDKANAVTVNELSKIINDLFSDADPLTVKEMSDDEVFFDIFKEAGYSQEEIDSMSAADKEKLYKELMVKIAHGEIAYAESLDGANKDGSLDIKEMTKLLDSSQEGINEAILSQLKDAPEEALNYIKENILDISGAYESTLNLIDLDGDRTLSTEELASTYIREDGADNGGFKGADGKIDFVSSLYSGGDLKTEYAEVYKEVFDGIEVGTDKTAETSETGETEGAPDVEGTETTEETTDKTLSEEEVSGLEDEVTSLKKEISELDTKIKEAEENLAKKEAELEAKKKELDDEKARLEEEKAKLQELQDEYDKNKEEYDKIKESIEEATKDLEEDMKEKQQDAIYKAMANYNPEEHGDNWDAYLRGQLEDVVGSAALTSLLSDLSSKETTVLRNLGKLQIDINAQSLIVKNIETNVGTLQTECDTLGTEIDGIKASIDENKATKADKEATLSEKTATLESARRDVSIKTDPTAYESKTTPVGDDKLVEDKKLEDLKAMVSEEEYALVEKMGVDLFEKLENGEPRYIFAPGANDGKYHIYDMSGKLTDAGDNSLVRLYYGYTEESYGIIACGNGGITPGTWSKLGSETQDGRQVFYADDCGTVKTYQACYQTWSPLSLDLNGDGVQTSDKIVEFDIDGDGVLDKIHDSADGVLVFDKDGDGISGEDGSETFGDGTDLDGDGVKDGYKDGFEALKAFAEKEGLINNKDDMVLDEKDIKYLEENFGFGIKAGGYTSETQTLSELGITEINLAKTDETTLEDNFDGRGNQLMTQEGATFVQNGETKEYADIWHRKLDDSEVSADKADGAAKAKESARKGAGSLTFNNVALNNNNDENVWMDLLNTKLETEALKKTEINKFNVFDVDVDKPESEEDDKKKKVDENEDVK